MIDLIKGVLARPSETFRDIPEQATVRDAALVVLAVALLGAAPMFLAPAGIGLRIALAAVTLVFNLAIWLAVGGISGFLAVKVLKGPGTVGLGLVVAGFAYVPLGVLVLGGMVMGILQMAPATALLIVLLFMGWAILLLYIGTRETRNLSGMGVAAAIVPAVAVGFLLGGTQSRIENYLRCFEELPHYAVVVWEELPETYEQALRNPGFEEAHAPGEEPQPRHRGGVPLAPGWTAHLASPFAFLNEPSCELVDGAGQDGGRAVRLRLEGVPQKDMQVAAFQEVPLAGGAEQAAFLAVRMKSEDAVIAGAQATFWTDAPQAPAAGGMRTEMVGGTTGWAEYRVKGTIPPNARRAVVAFVLQGSGTLWVDEIRLYLPDEEAREEAEEDEDHVPATLATAPERAVAELRRSAPPGSMGAGKAFFVAPVSDFTADRVDTVALREALEGALTGEAAGAPVSRRAERSAELNEIAFLSGSFVSRRDAQDRGRKAGADLVFFGELVAEETPGRAAFSLWMMDVGKGDIVAQATVPVFEGLRD